MNKTSRKRATPTPAYQYSSIEAKQGAYILRLFFAPAKDIFKFVSINEKEEDSEDGYQRIASPARTAAITRFIEKGNPIPTSLLITLSSKHITLSSNEINITGGKKSGWVIDGQHRLIGAMNAKLDILLPVVAFIGLSLEDQIQQFVTINKEAKGVPTSLYYSLLKKIPVNLTAAERAKERAADVASALRQDEASPFSGRIIVTAAPRTGQLSLVNFVRKISPLVKDDQGLLGTYSLEEQIKILNNYFIALRNVFGKKFDSTDSPFFATVGFGGVINLFPQVFSHTISHYKSFNVADATSALESIKHIDPNEWKNRGTGSAAEINLGKDLTVEFKKLAVVVGAIGSGLKLD